MSTKEARKMTVIAAGPAKQTTLTANGRDIVHSIDCRTIADLNGAGSDTFPEQLTP